MPGRRRFVAMAGAAVLAVLAARMLVSAQTRTPRLGIVTGAARSRDALLAGLRDLGYVAGKNIEVQHVAAEGQPDRYRPAIEQVLKRSADVVVVSSSHGLKAATSLTKTVPIVVVDLESDPVASGVMASLARPGGNVSGLFLDVPEMSGKLVQLLAEAVPALTHLAVLWDAAMSRAQFDATERAAQRAGINVLSVPSRSMSELESAVARSVRAGARALVVLSAPRFRVNQARVDEIALRHRLPSVTVFDLLPNGNGFLAYGPDLDEMFRRSASYVDRVLKGARIGDLPVERPSKFNLGVNLRTATALGITIPQSLLLRADLLIQ